MSSSASINLSERRVEARGLRLATRLRTHTQLIAISVIGAIYVLQALTPMRLDNDSVVYLNMARNMTDGLPLQSTGLPAGYPAFISLLERIGLGVSWLFVLANCAFIAAGLVAVAYLFDRRDDGRQSWVVPLTMLSVPVIRYIAMPMPEAMFFGISLVAVALMTAATRSSGRRRFALLGAALVLTAIAITVRLVGFALVPALVWACLHREDQQKTLRRSWTRREKWMAWATIITTSVVALLLLGDSLVKYAYEAGLKYLDPMVLSLIRVQIRGFFARIGEVAINLPSSQFGGLRLVLVALGVTASIWVATRVRLRAPRTPASIYFVTFVLVLLLWPYNALRLWLPIVPLLIGYAERATLRFEPGRKWNAFVTVYRAWFVVAGLAALAYTTRITLSGENFSKVYGKGAGMSLPDPKTGAVNEEHNRRALALKKRYGNPFLISLPDWSAGAKR